MMQSSALAQATLAAYDAKRLLGPIQLGASAGAMGAAAAGPLVALGAPAMALVQGACSALDLAERKIRRARHAGGGKAAAARAEGRW